MRFDIPFGGNRTFSVRLKIALSGSLVDEQSGDVIWATTQESNGAKYKGAAADAADKIIKRLMWDIEKLEKARQSEKKPPAD